MCKALHRHLLACGLFKPACTAPQCVQPCWEQHLFICIWAAWCKCFPRGLELVLGTQAQPLCSATPQSRDAVPCRLSSSCCSTIVQGSETDWVPSTWMVPVVLGWGQIHLLGSPGIFSIISEQSVDAVPFTWSQTAELPSSCSQSAALQSNAGHVWRVMVVVFTGQHWQCLAGDDHRAVLAVCKAMLATFTG